MKIPPCTNPFVKMVPFPSAASEHETNASTHVDVLGWMTDDVFLCLILNRRPSGNQTHESQRNIRACYVGFVLDHMCTRFGTIGFERMARRSLFSWYRKDKTWFGMELSWWDAVALSRRSKRGLHEEHDEMEDGR